MVQSTENLMVSHAQTKTYNISDVFMKASAEVWYSSLDAVPKDFRDSLICVIANELVCYENWHFGSTGQALTLRNSVHWRGTLGYHPELDVPRRNPGRCNHRKNRRRRTHIGQNRRRQNLGRNPRCKLPLRIGTTRRTSSELIIPR
jgi:hypothetical protein